MFDTKESKEFLIKAGIFFDEDDVPHPYTINLNDTFGWAVADGETVAEEDLPRLAELFYRYGRCGVLYWVSEKRNGMRSEFHDVNRRIDFVRKEEELKKAEPNSSKRAYTKVVYTLGEKE